MTKPLLSMMKMLLCFFVLLFVSLKLMGQIDSLKKELNVFHGVDIEKVKIYNALSEAYWKEHTDSSMIYAEKAYQLAVQLNSPEDIAKALIRKSIVFNNDNQEQKAFELLTEAEKIAKIYGFRKIETLIYHGMGLAHKKQPDTAIAYYHKSIKVAAEAGFEDLVIKNKIRLFRALLHQKRHQELAELYNTLIPELERIKDYDGLAELYTYVSLTFRDLNEQEKALLYAEKALLLAEKSKDKRLISFINGVIGSGVTGYFEEFEKAEPLVQKSIRLAIEINDKLTIKNGRKRLAFLHFSNYDDEKAASIVDSLLVDSVDPDVFKLKAMLLSAEAKYEHANSFYDKAYQLYEDDKAFIQQKIVLQNKVNNKLVLLGDKELVSDFSLLDSLTKIIHDTESKSQFFDLETKYRTAEKEAEIQRKKLELAKSNNRILLVSGIALFLFGLGVFGIWFMRNRQRRKELEQANQLLELQYHLNATELANLNNQLNPHEIKNLITSVAPELITKAPDAYKKMIKLFNVTRASLSNKLTESLDIQIQQAEDYLLLKQSISPYLWKFEFVNEVEVLTIELPRLLLKNMVENAVKHGMKTMKEKGEIRILLSKDKYSLRIEVKDNGKGIDMHKNEESTGIGFSTYQKIFTIANVHNERKASLILNRDNDWTKVEILIPLNYRYQ